MVGYQTTAASYGGKVHATRNTMLEAENLANEWRLTPATLYKKINPSWIPKDFLLNASMEFAQAVVRGNSYLSLNAPPRHGKSRLTTIAGPIWTLENFPEKHVILCTYGADLSTDFGRIVRDTIMQNEDLLNVRIRKDVSRVGHFETIEGGGMTSVGIGGPITGRGADVLLIDDYIKTIDEAESKTYRDKLWAWLTTTALTRLEPGATVIIVVTRWHADDVIGRLKKEFGDLFKFIEYKAEAVDGDPLGRKPGEPLFEERYPSHILQTRKRLLGNHYYQALFQQDPEDEDSKRTDRAWIRVINEVPASNNWKSVRVWDFAGTKNGGDWTVGGNCLFNTVTHDFIIADIDRFQGSPKKVEDSVVACSITDGPGTQIVIEEEPGSSGKHLVFHYQQKKELRGFRVKGAPNTTSKLIRANPFIAAAEAGKVFILNRPWNEAFLKEFDDFPEGDNDDQVDVASIAYNELADVNSNSPTWGRGIPTASETDDESAVHSALRDIRGLNGREHLLALNAMRKKRAAEEAIKAGKPSRMMAISGDYTSRLRRRRSGSTGACWGR